MANLLLVPSGINDSNLNSPPVYYVNGVMIVEGELDYTFVGNSLADAVAGSSLSASGFISIGGNDNPYFCVRDEDGNNLYSIALPEETQVDVSFNVQLPAGKSWKFGIFIAQDDIRTYSCPAITLNLVPTPSEAVSYNCDCDEGDNSFESKTLLELRQDMLIDLGYSQQLNNPPTGIVLKIDRALQRAQRFLYLEHEEYRISRYYTWEMVPGVRFYDLIANTDACTKKLSPDRIEWAGMSDGDRWYPLGYGIPAEFYSDPQIVGRPYRYEIRQCIEVWPAPEVDTLKLRIKGEFGLLPFLVDADRTTINPDAVFNWAMYTFLNSKGETAKGETYAALANAILDQRTAAGHGTARYVPGTVVRSPEPRPIFLGLEE